VNAFRLHREDAKARRLNEATEALGAKVVSAVFQVHKELGPGLLESVYEVCLAHEFSREGISFERQVTLPVHYKGLKLDAGLRIDMIVQNRIILELKAVENLLPVHQAQLMTYLKLSGHSLGFLINFNIPLIKDGIKRVIFHHTSQSKD